jgi:hypothetical protein
VATTDLTPDRGATRRSTETKAAYKTTEFYAYVVAVLSVLIAADNIGGNLARDYFRADKAWLYVTILTVGYMISRGLAKSGSREPYTDMPDRAGDGAPLTERVKTAAAVLKDGDAATAGSEPRPPQPEPLGR